MAMQIQASNDFTLSDQCAAAGVCRYWAQGRHCKNYDIMATPAGRWCQLLHPHFVNNHGSLMDTLQNIQCHRFSRGKCFLTECRHVHLPLSSMMTKLRDTEINMVFHVRSGRVLPVNVPDADPALPATASASAGAAGVDLETNRGASITPTQPDSPAAPKALGTPQMPIIGSPTAGQPDSPASSQDAEMANAERWAQQHVLERDSNNYWRPRNISTATANGWYTTAFSMPPWHDGHDWRSGFRGDFLRNGSADLHMALDQATALRSHFNPDLPCFFGAQLNCYASDIYDVLNDECSLLQGRITNEAAETARRQRAEAARQRQQ